MPFSKQTLDFLFENRLHDSRAWFEEHKEEYRQLVIEPLRALVGALAPEMLKIDGDFVTEPRVGKTISRIWRDTRYSHDPSLYRDSMWIIFKRGRMHTTEFPGFYVEIGGSGFNYGCGFYQASTAYMRTLRDMIAAGNPSYFKAQEAFASQRIFHMEGDCFKRPHYPSYPEEARGWLERRNLCFVADSADFDLLFSDKLAQKLIRDLKKLAPVYDFLLQVALAQPQVGLGEER